jgi:hypothetical protein
MDGMYNNGYISDIETQSFLSIFYTLHIARISEVSSRVTTDWPSFNHFLRIQAISLGAPWGEGVSTRL